MKTKVFAFLLSMLCVPSAFAQLNYDANVFSIGLLGGYLDPNQDYFFNYAPDPSASYGITLGYMRVNEGKRRHGLYYGAQARFMMSRMEYDLISFEDATTLPNRFPEGEEAFRTYISDFVIENLRVFDFGVHLHAGYRVGPIGLDVPVVVGLTNYGYRSRTDGFRNWLINEINEFWEEDTVDIPYIVGDFEIDSGFSTSYGLALSFFVPFLPDSEYLILRTEYLRVVHWGSTRDPLPDGTTPSNPISNALNFMLVFGFEF